MDALIPVVRGERKLLIAANAASDIRSALDWAEERGITDQVVLSGALEGWRVDDAIEAGMRANLFVADGDPFQPATDIVHLFIDGYKLPLENRQSKLYDEYLHRTPGLDK